jgi:hypothetical protein
MPMAATSKRLNAIGSAVGLPAEPIAREAWNDSASDNHHQHHHEQLAAGRAFLENDVVHGKFVDAFFDCHGIPRLLAGPSRHVSREMRRRKRSITTRWVSSGARRRPDDSHGLPRR